MPENKQLEEFKDKLITRFSQLEYQIKTKRKTMPIEMVKATVDAVLQNGCADIINTVYNEMMGISEETTNADN